jgi:hypothetical protein
VEVGSLANASGKSSWDISWYSVRPRLELTRSMCLDGRRRRGQQLLTKTIALAARVRRRTAPAVTDSEHPRSLPSEFQPVRCA